MTPPKRQIIILLIRALHVQLTGYHKTTDARASRADIRSHPFSKRACGFALSSCSSPSHFRGFRGPTSSRARHAASVRSITTSRKCGWLLFLSLPNRSPSRCGARCRDHPTLVSFQERTCLCFSFLPHRSRFAKFATATPERREIVPPKHHLQHRTPGGWSLCTCHSTLQHRGRLDKCTYRLLQALFHMQNKFSRA